MAKSGPLLRRLRAALREASEPDRAPAMQAYMKSQMPYLGVRAPKAKAVFREVFARCTWESSAAWRADVLSLWRDAEYREERYGAIALTGHRQAKKLQDTEALPLYEEMITTGAWWDYVDEIAANRIGGLLAAHPKPMKKAMLTWSRSTDMWKRRTSILCQLRLRDATDRELLYTCIEPSLASKEFFLRKAIGWSLRELAKHDPEEVRRYVDIHDAALSPLSKREALRHLA